MLHPCQNNKTMEGVCDSDAYYNAGRKRLEKDRVTSITNEEVNMLMEIFTASNSSNAANFTNIDNLSDAVIYEFVNELVVENYKAMSSEEEPKVIRKNDDAP
ncbi:hypothetical protein Tco_0281586 [Tanacetum coccineum]